MRQILIIAKEDDFLNSLPSNLGEGFSIQFATNRISGLEFFQSKRYDLTFIDFRLLKNPDDSLQKAPHSSLAEFREVHPEAPLVILSLEETVPQTVELVEKEADGYLTLPFKPEEFELIAHRLLKERLKEAELRYLRDQFWSADFEHIIETDSAVMKELFQNIKDVAPTKSTVLLTGETGVGKTLIAQLIHRHSTRKDRQFIRVHCGAIPESLIESELFGHEKGAFTGALKRKLGKFELANGGTIFLDEVSTLTASAQVKLLQVVQESLFQRVGGENDVHVDIRIIAATNEDLKSLSEEGNFRKDLFYRLNVFPLFVPPLRERKEDLANIIQVFIDKLNLTHQKQIKGVQKEALEALKRYEWPGNVRELENLVERAYILEKTPFLTAESFPLEVVQQTSTTAVLPLNIKLPLAEARNRMIDNFERQYLKELLTETHGKINQTAEIAGISTRQLNKLMNKYGLITKAFKSAQDMQP
ncbi:MAG: sigma-54-dependent Fis family transcriptional regulator [Bdellovibrionales bacterium]|nr:sigma-54-dependent Fis family transcriptional regulator [Bdellovibrionales bacterium]